MSGRTVFPPANGTVASVHPLASQAGVWMRVNASIRFMELTATVGVSLVAAAAAESIGMRWILAGGAFSLMLAGVWLEASPVRKLRQSAPTPAQVAAVIT